MITKDQAIDLLKPYWEDPSRRGMTESGSCMNLTPDGKKCVVGRQLKHEIAENHPNAGVALLHDYVSGAGIEESDVYVATLRGFLRDDEKYGDITVAEWQALQGAHDGGNLRDLRRIFDPSDIDEIADALGGMEIPT